MRSIARTSCGIIAVVTLVIWAPDAGAFPSTSNCVGCHVIFSGGPGSVGHQGHLGLGLPLSCNTCHVEVGDTPDTDKCGVCHVEPGLPNHHQNALVASCVGCHPGTPAPEDTPVPGYATITQLLDPCDGSEERFASFTVSLDNDGDLLYDVDDPDCQVSATTTTTTTTTTSSTTQPPGSTTTTATQPPTTTTTTPPVGDCPAQPDLSCEDSFEKGLLLVNEKTAGKEKMIAKWIKGPALAGTDFGNPLGAGGTAYNICIYDGAGALAAEYVVARAGDSCAGKDCWKSIGNPPPDAKHKGYKYKDKDIDADGILLMLLKGGDAGKSKALAKGKNDTGTLPTGVASSLTGSTSATVQLFGSDAPKCVSVTLPTVLKDDGVQFKAKK